MSPILMERYRSFLPITEATPIISLGEGNTPLVRAIRLEKEFGCGQLYFKLESCNPTGSFKDRGMVVAVANAMERGNKAIVCASTGNTSAATAAYATRFGLTAVVVVPKGGLATGKLAQAFVFGAKIVVIDGTFDRALDVARALSQRHPVVLVNSINPYRIQGQKTASFEIIDELGDAPDAFFIPVGNAGNISAYWQGFVEYHQAGKASRRPRMMGFQAEGAAPIVRGTAVANPQTIASAIRVGNPASWQGAVAARDESEGVIDSVTDDEIMEAYRLMAIAEGIFGEPAAAAPLAGLMKMARNGHDFSRQRVVCVVTGSGLKDPETALKYTSIPKELPPDVAAVEAALGWG
ncbi:MAG: threonine synthase [Chloroflexi bacterium]|nr:threonine synthase [Chloroflexota bacterium]